MSSGSGWYALFTLTWGIRGVTPATLTAVGVVRTTVYGPFQRGAKESCLQSLTHTWSPGTNLWICSPKGNSTLFCINLVTQFITLPSSICCEILFPLTWGKFADTCFIMGGGPPIHNFVRRIALGPWGHPESEQSRRKQVHPGAVSLYDPLGESL